MARECWPARSSRRRIRKQATRRTACSSTTERPRQVGVTALVLRDIHATFPDAHTTIEEIAAIGDQVVVRLTASGTHLGVGRLPVNGGMLVGVEPTGKRYSVQHIHWFTLCDGLIIEHRANRDDVGMMVQLGLLPAPPPFGAPPNP